jgi:hypothetical protein
MPKKYDSWTGGMPEPPGQNYGVQGGGGGPMGGMFGSGGGMTQPPPFNSEIEVDPNLQWQVDAYKNAMGTSDLQKQKQMIGQDVMDSANAQGRALSGLMSRRGISDSGVEMKKQAENMDAAQRQKNRLYAEAELADTKRRDALLLGGQGIMQAPGQFQAGQAQNAFNNWLGTNQFYANQQNNAFNQMQSMLQLFQPQGGYGANMKGAGGSIGQMMPSGVEQGPWGSVYNDPWLQGFLKQPGGGAAGIGGY